MKRRNYLFILAFALILMPLTLAHVPQKSGVNDSLDNPLFIGDPLKSWVFYSELTHSEDARYYELVLDAGERLKISILTPESGQFSPRFILSSENIVSNVILPEYLEVHEGHGTLDIGENKSGPEYEPFTPGAYYETAEHTEILEDGGTYYVIVYEENGLTGSFGLVVGYQELFSPLEIVRVPIDTIWIHRWEGQSYLGIFYPMAIVVIIGLYYIFSRIGKDGRPKDFMGLVTSIIGFAYIGSGAIFINQIIYAASRTGYSNMMVISFLFVSLPLILGITLIRFGFSDRTKYDVYVRLRPLTYGILGLFTWSGIIVFPILCILMSFFPQKLISRKP